MDYDSTTRLTGGYNISDLISSANLAATTDTTLVVPAGATKAIIQVDSPKIVYFGFSTIIVSSSAVFGTSNYISITGKQIVSQIPASSTLHFFAPLSDTRVFVSFYR